MTYPTVEFEFFAHEPPMHDGFTGQNYLVPPPDYKPLQKTLKIARQDLLSGVTSVMRDVERLGVHLLIGNVARPRIVEYALAA